MPYRQTPDSVPLHSVQSPFFNQQEQAGREPPHLQRVVYVVAALMLAACALLAARPADAVEQAVVFGAPTVLSQQGQRLKVAVPLQTAQHDHATAAAFLVRTTKSTEGFGSPEPEGFTVMRPAESPYVVFQSDDIVKAPDLTMTFSVAGDPNSPYRMDLKIPVDASGSLAALDGINPRDSRDGGRSLKTRRVAGKAAPKNLPPK